jgi:AraC family transcriptional regulator, transcriptional activator of pobA
MKSKVIETEDKLGDVPFYIDRFHEKIKKTEPHKHEDYYELIFLSEGEGFHWIETEEYMVTAPEFYFLKPGQLHCWQFTSIPKGYIIMFKTSYFDHVRECNILNLCRQLADRFRIDVPANYSPEPLFNAMLEEFRSVSEFSVNIINGLLTALVSKMLQLASIQSNEKQIPITLYDRFLDLVFKECPRLHLVTDYAQLLNTTPQNINAACHKHSGKSAGEHISSHLLLEAKRYILHTDSTINEIADILSFNDASYFGKFFKTHEGITPVQFRAKYTES